MECYEMPTMAAVRKRAEIAKRVAALLAENATTVSEIDAIFISDYDALHACVRNDAVDVAKLLLDGGMNFEQYRQEYVLAGHEETVQALEEHWNEFQTQKQGQELDDTPQMGV